MNFSDLDVLSGLLTIFGSLGLTLAWEMWRDSFMDKPPKRCTDCEREQV